MKKIKNLLLLVFAIMVVVICKAKEPKDYATFSGKITNYKGNFINLDQCYVFPPRIKKIKIANDGTFSDTLHIKDKALFFVLIGNERLSIVMKKGNDLKLTVDNKKIYKTFEFTGSDAKVSDYLSKADVINKEYNGPYSSVFDLDEQSFNKKRGKIKNKLSALLEEYKNSIDKDIYLWEKKRLSTFEDYSKLTYENRIKQKEDISAIKEEKRSKENKYDSFIGKPSPKFINYENFKGGTSSLKDFKGKYVYIDVWSTG
jgi:hypothetical protein